MAHILKSSYGKRNCFFLCLSLKQCVKPFRRFHCCRHAIRESLVADIIAVPGARLTGGACMHGCGACGVT